MTSPTSKVKLEIDTEVTGDRDVDKLAQSTSQLNRQLDETSRRVKDLNTQFDRTGDTSLFKEMKDARRTLSNLQRIRREMDSVALAAKKAEEAAKRAEADRIKQMTTPGGVRGNVGGISLPINSTTLAIGGTAAAGLAPVVFAGAGGAILAGGAGAGVGLGIAGAAARNPAIGQAASTALADETQRWKDASMAFEAPTLRAIAHIKDAVDDIPLEEILKNASEFVDPLARGVAGLTRAIGQGVGSLVEDAGPVIAVLGRELPRLGKSFKVMFEEIGEGSEGGAEALQDILQITSRIIIGTGKVIHFFEELYAAGIKLRKALPGDMWNDDEVAIEGFSQSLGATAVEFHRVADSASDATEEVETYEETLHRLLDLPMDLAEANAAYQESLDNLTESIKENKRNWDEGTEAGRSNNEALRDAVNRAVAVRDAQIAMGVQSGTANKQLEAQIAKLRAQAVAAGMSAAEFDRLTGALRNYIATPANKVITTRFVTEGSAPRMSTPGRQFAFAEGGPATPGPILVGEGGKPEWLWLDKPGYVTQVGQTPPGTRGGNMSYSSSGGGPLSITMGFTGNTNTYLAQAVMHGVRTGEIPLFVNGQRVTVR